MVGCSKKSAFRIFTPLHFSFGSVQPSEEKALRKKFADFYVFNWWVFCCHRWVQTCSIWKRFSLVLEASANQLVQLWLDGFHVNYVYELNTELYKSNYSNCFPPNILLVV